ncbi:MAG: acyl-CoA dehydrogenase family protein [Rhodoferax sp.]|nr:acyl-CoA dehydrogenase family protein [Rhodoferax sp.]MCP5263394.1 acyl-CoA dehydrogenase family protein [Rhodoferax sp.]
MEASILKEFLETIERLVREELVPAEEETIASDRVSERIRGLLRDLGLYGMTVPEEYGGLGMTSAEEVEVLFRLCFASVAYRNLLGTNNGVGSGALLAVGSAEQKQKYLPEIAAGRIVTAFAITENDSGSDASSLRTQARKVEGGWQINGVKRFITNAPEAQLFTVLARSSERPGASGISAFLVERNTPGISIGSPEKKMGQQGSHVADVILSDVFVSDSSMLGGEGEGLKLAMRLVNRGRLTIAAASVGVAERALHEALQYAIQRRQFGSRIADFQLVQALLADSRAEIAAAKALVRETAGRHSAGEDIQLDASCAKMFASEMAGRVADRAVQIHGGMGYMVGTVAERLYRDARLFRIYEGTTQIQQITIAKQMLRQLG